MEEPAPFSILYCLFATIYLTIHKEVLPMGERTTAEEVLQELRAVGLSRPADCLCITDGRVELKPEALAQEAAAAIAYMECTDKGWKIKFYDKLKALEMLGDHFGLFREQPSRQQEECNLLEAIVEATKEDLQLGELSELQ